MDVIKNTVQINQVRTLPKTSFHMTYLVLKLMLWLFAFDLTEPILKNSMFFIQSTKKGTLAPSVPAALIRMHQFYYNARVFKSKNSHQLNKLWQTVETNAKWKSLHLQLKKLQTNKQLDFCIAPPYSVSDFRNLSCIKYRILDHW